MEDKNTFVVKSSSLAEVSFAAMQSSSPTVLQIERRNVHKIAVQYAKSLFNFDWSRDVFHGFTSHSNPLCPSICNFCCSGSVIAESIVVVRMTLHTVDNGYSIAIYVFTFMLHTPSVPFYLTPILRIVFSNYFSNFLKSREIFCIFTFLPLVLNNNIH